jgi:hypothetical protein
LNKRGRGTRFHDVKQQAVTADVEGMNDEQRYGNKETQMATG